MTIVEKNIREWNEELGLKDEYINQGIEQGIEKGIEQGIEKGIEKRNIYLVKNAYEYNYPINDIMKITGLSQKSILQIIKKC